MAKVALIAAIVTLIDLINTEVTCLHIARADANRPRKLEYFVDGGFVCCSSFRELFMSILDQDLRADALRVAASRQVRSGNAWVDAPVQAATTQKLEQIILTKARDLRRGAITN